MVTAHWRHRSSNSNLWGGGYAPSSYGDAGMAYINKMHERQRIRKQLLEDRRRRRAEESAARRARRRERRAESVAAAPDVSGLSPFELNRREASLRRNRRPGDRSAGNGRETSRGQGVADDIAAAGDIGRRDRGGLRALERGATVGGYGGTVTPGQRRGFEQTREAGKFPVYGKQMQAAQSFRGAFAQARGEGKKIFEWQGRKYTTDLA